MGRETKIGLVLILILVSAFSFVVYKKLKNKPVDVVEQTEQQPDGEQPASTAGEPDLTETFASAGSVRPVAHAPAIPDQNEPSDPFGSDSGDSSAAITDAAPVRSIPNTEPRQLLDLSESSDGQPSVRRPIGIPDEPETQQESDFSQNDEQRMPARSTEIGIAETEPSQVTDQSSNESLPTVDSSRSVSQPLLVESPRSQTNPPQLSTPTKSQNRAPAITLSSPEGFVETPSDSTDKLEGFGIASQKRDNLIVPAGDDRIEGFREVPVDGRRAFAQTRVAKPATPIVAVPTRSDRNVTGPSNDLVPIHPKRTGGATLTSDPFEVSPAKAVVRRTASAQLAGMATPSQSIPGSLRNPDSEVYTIQPNDSFWSISRRQYGTGRYFQALAKCNAEQIPDPAQLKPGQQVATPSREVLERKFPMLIDGIASRSMTVSAGGLSTNADNETSGFFLDATGQPFYRVGADDTLTSISQRHLGRASRWTEIYEKNADQLKTADSLKIGTVLRLPPDASQVRVVQQPGARR